MINQMVKNEPKLKYTPCIAANTFMSLLKTNPHKAWEYGREMLAASTYEESLNYFIYDNVEFFADKLNLPAEIYRLAIEAYLVDIDQYPETTNIPKAYHKMAAYHWHANEKSAAVDTEQKAIEALKNKKDFSKADMAEFESRLQQYRSR